MGLDHRPCCGLRGRRQRALSEWNKTKRFGRACIDAENDPCVELDYDLEGGVSDESIKVWFDTVTAIVRSFEAHVTK